MAGKMFSIKELVVPIGIVACVATMILPVPSFMMDFLLVANLILALILLMSSFYISEPLKLSALPTILLLSTLYRLALNISTTRLILGRGDAGDVIEAFGKIVIQGNLVVGTVIFLIITLVQFIVIAKGSERVAEVSARFTLDALPGKQMSIDADVRSGLLDAEMARVKRQELQSESRFYGALDGAMKFVKGDAVAGLIVTLINITGGLAVGIVTYGLTIGEATQKYTLLTVGDGLLSQIPALLNALASGVIVTRVAKGDGASLATEVLQQLGQIRAAKFMVGGLACVLAIVPGMPILPFLALGVIFMVAGAIDKPERIQIDEGPLFQPRSHALITIELTPDLARQFQGTSNVVEIIDNLRQRIFDKTGLIIPRPSFEVSPNQGLYFSIGVRGIKVFSERISDEKIDMQAHLIASVEHLVSVRRAELLDDIMTRRLLDNFDSEAPELVAAVVPQIISLTQLTEILRQLANDQITIRHFDMILQAIAEQGAKASSERVLLEEVRVAIGRVIVDSLIQAEGTIAAYTLDPVLDLAFLNVEREIQAVNTTHVALIENFLRSRIESQAIILAVSKGSRRIVSEFLKMRGLNVIVIAYEEIPTEIVIEPLDTIGLPSDEKNEVLSNLVAA